MMFNRLLFSCFEPSKLFFERTDFFLSLHLGTETLKMRATFLKQLECRSNLLKSFVRMLSSSAAGVSS